MNDCVGSDRHRQRRAVIAGTGSYVPNKVLTNADLEKMVDTSDEWITVRTGIKERRIVDDGQTTATLACEAARQAMDAAGVTADQLDLIICATITPEMVFPSTACFIQQELGNNSCCAFDISAACSGFTYGVATAATMIESGRFQTALVLGAETLSTITDYTDRTTCILFGDGSGAAVLQGEDDSDRGVLYSSLHADGNMWETISCRAFGSRHPVSKPLESESLMYMEVRGRETYQLAVRRIVEMVEEACGNYGVSSDDLAMIIPHQMNLRIIESVIKRLRLPQDKMFVNIEKYGNTSSASIAIALDEAVRQNHLKPGDLIALVAFGAGLTWAINLIRI